MQAVILAGGLAMRLRPMTEKIPKSMIEVAGKPFLEYQIDLMKRNEVNDLVLCVGYLSEHIENYFEDGKKFGVSVKYSKEGKNLLGTAGAIKNAQHLLDKMFFEMNGDSLLPISLREPLEQFLGNQKLGMMVVYRNFNQREKSNIAIRDGFVTTYSKTEGEFEYIDAGISIFRKEAFEIVPENSACDLSYLLHELIKRKELLAYETKQKVYEIGSVEGLAEFKSSVNEITNLMAMIS